MSQSLWQEARDILRDETGQALGEDATLKDAQAVVNKSTGAASTTLRTTTCKMLPPRDYRKELIGGASGIRLGDLRATVFAGGGLAFDPTAGMRLAFGSREYEIVDLEENRVAGVVLSWELHLRGVQ